MTHVCKHGPLSELVYVPPEHGLRLANSHLIGISQREGSTHSIMMYTIMYHKIIANINVIRYESIPIITKTYPDPIHIFVHFNIT